MGGACSLRGGRWRSAWLLLKKTEGKRLSTRPGLGWG